MKKKLRKKKKETPYITCFFVYIKLLLLLFTKIIDKLLKKKFARLKADQDY